MILLKRYVLKQFLQNYFLILGGLVGIFVFIDAFERMDDFLIKKAPLSDFLFYYIYKIPFILFYMAPQSVLLTTVITLATLSRNNEFIAMKACGISVTGITMPILSMSLIISLCIVILNEFIAPITSQKMNYILYVKVRGIPDQAKLARDNLWYRSPNGAIWNINYFDPNEIKMKGISILFYDSTYSNLFKRVDAKEAQWKDGRWEFSNGFTRSFLADGTNITKPFERKVIRVSEQPHDFQKIQKRPEEMSAREMFHTIQSYESEGVDTSPYWVDLNKKLSYPFIGVVMAFLGIPVALISSRRGGLLYCIAASLVMGFGFSLFYGLGISLGKGGTFHPILAAWGPNLLFICIGLYLLLTVDSDSILPI